MTKATTVFLINARLLNISLVLLALRELVGLVFISRFYEIDFLKATGAAHRQPSAISGQSPNS